MLRDAVSAPPAAESGKRIRSLSSLRSLELSLAVHAVSFAWFLRVWVWHTTNAASFLPGASGFGWFLRYLTFWSYTLQTVLYGLATLDDVQQLRAVRTSSSAAGGAHHHHHHHHHYHYTRRAGLARAVDDLACATYALAHVVTLMFIAIQSTTKGAVEGGHLQRPWWLDASVHKLNVLAVHLDMMTAPSPRDFSPASLRLSLGIIASYLSYLLLCRRMNGRFPYPFMNAMPWPGGFIAVVVAGLSIFAAAFKLGAAFNARASRLRLRIEVAAGDDAGSGGAFEASVADDSSGGEERTPSPPRVAEAVVADGARRRRG